MPGLVPVPRERDHERALSALRERSGSLAAPVLLQLTANCAGPLASAVGSRLERRANRSAAPKSGPARLV